MQVKESPDIDLERDEGPVLKVFSIKAYFSDGFDIWDFLGRIEMFVNNMGLVATIPEIEDIDDGTFCCSFDIKYIESENEARATRIFLKGLSRFLWKLDVCVKTFVLDKEEVEVYESY
ncbi:MAG: hypothetical protein DRO11_00170 [Methanobacteriota archaeon]|nr:MAG: hypothetical protein DRO11_00170 [Euryarchaeota archaeon]